MTQAIDEQALLSRLRAGQDDAFSSLFEAHAPAVRRLARSLAGDASEAEDITAETFFRVLRAIKRGNGPNDNVRGYLLTVARRVAWEWKGASHDVPVSDDELTHRAGASEPAAANAAEYSLITRAFTSLPERWRTVLWRTEVEGDQPANVAPHFGLSANATAALARRARQGLRAAYLQAHLGTHRGDTGCRSVLDKLGSYTAGAVTAAEASRISAHLGGCSGCRSTHDELRDVCHSLRANSAAIVLALPAAAGAGSLLSTGTAAAPGKAAALKTVLGGAKAKIGAAVASTAVVGVLGLSAGPAINDSAVDALGLHGQQGVSQVDPTVDRATGEDGAAMDAETLPNKSDKRDDTAWGLPASERKAKPRLQSTGKSAAAAVQELSGSADADEPMTHPDVGDTLGDLQSDSTSQEEKSDSSTGEPRKDGEVRNPKTKTQPPPESTTPPESGSQPHEEPPATTWSDVQHDCVDTYDSYEYYNEEEGRYETYEYSYVNGEGYETTTYEYDNGDFYSYTYYWADDC